MITTYVFGFQGVRLEKKCGRPARAMSHENSAAPPRITRIEALEIAGGKATGKVREKFKKIPEMLQALRKN